jgi:threonine synthase
MRLQGQKTAAFEVVEALGDAPDVHVLPTGNAGNISAYWLGYREARASGEASRLPVMRGWQAEGAAPLVSGAPVAEPETVASAIRIGNPASWELAVAAADQSGGKFRSVTDDQILAAQRELASREGVFVEPASAAGVAGLLLEAAEGVRYDGQRIAVTVTGHGLKDVDTALSTFTDLVDTVCDADVDAAAAAAGLG